MATDPRDKLYLAQQIAHDAPDVSIMTAESDSLYGHPDYSSYLQGAVVASTYPLFSGNQRWSYGFQGDSQRRQLANGSSQGIYNAALALLNYTQDGTPYDADSAQSGHIKSVPKLLEYSSPMERSSADASCAGDYQPPIWISVVGRSGAWPVRAYPAPASDALSKVRPPKRSYVFHVRLAAAARQDALTTFPSPIFVAMCIVLMSATLVGWLGARSCLPKLIAENPAIAPAGSQPLKGLSYVLLCILSVFVIDAFVAAILLARFRIDWTFWCGAALAAIVVSVALLADLTSRVVAHGWPNRRTASWARVDVDKVAMWRGTGIGAVALWAVGNLLLYVYPLFISTSSIDTIGFVTRAISFGSGVCPTLPVLFLMAALALWTIAELKRAWTPGAALADLEVHKVIVRTVTGTVEKMSPHWAFFNRSIVAVPPELAVVVAFAVAAACIFAFDPVVSPLVTVEGPRFGRFVSTGLLATETLIGLSILQFIYLWWALKQLLDRMAWHPMADAYQHVPSDLFPPVVFPKIPRFMELQSAVTRWQQYVRSASPVSLRGAVIPVECRDIDLVFQGEMRKSPDQHWSKSKTWSLLVKALGRPALDSALVGTSMASFTGNEPTADAQEQDLIAVSMALVIRDAIARLGQNLVFITGGTLLVFCAHTLFPFQSHTQLAALDWTAIGLTFAAILIVLVQMKRHEIIGRVSSVTSAERTTWDAEFVLKLVVFCLLPLLTLFATQFPEVGATILSWLEPVEKALP